MLLSPYDLGVPGGVQGQVRAMALELQRRGRSVSVVAAGDGADPVLRGAGIQVTGFGNVLGVRANGSVAPISLSPAASRQAREFISSQPNCVVHLHEPVTPTLGWSTLRRYTGGMVGTFHRSGVDALYRATGPLLRRLVRHLDVSVAVSNAAASTARATLGIEPEVLFNGIDLEAAAAAKPWPTSGPTVLFLGRDEPRKGRQVLLEAARQLDSSVTIWLTGDPPDEASDGGAALEWLGVIDEEEKLRRLRAADVLCAPSLGGESFGMVLLEGLAADCTVVASDIDGYRQALGGQGMLAPPSDPVALAATLRTALAQRATRSPWAGVDYARQWSMETLMDSYEAFYEQAALHQRGASRH